MRSNNGRALKLAATVNKLFDPTTDVVEQFTGSSKNKIPPKHPLLKQLSGVYQCEVEQYVGTDIVLSQFVKRFYGLTEIGRYYIDVRGRKQRIAKRLLQDFMLYGGYFTSSDIAVPVDRHSMDTIIGGIPVPPVHKANPDIDFLPHEIKAKVHFFNDEMFKLKSEWLGTSWFWRSSGDYVKKNLVYRELAIISFEHYENIKRRIDKFWKDFRKSDIIFSVRPNDIARMSNTRHFLSCYRSVYYYKEHMRDQGENAGEPFQLMFNPNVFIVFVKDKSGKFQARRFGFLIRNHKTKKLGLLFGREYGSGLGDKVIYSVFGNKLDCYSYNMTKQRGDELVEVLVDRDNLWHETIYLDFHYHVKKDKGAYYVFTFAGLMNEKTLKLDD